MWRCFYYINKFTTVKNSCIFKDVTFFNSSFTINSGINQKISISWRMIPFGTSWFFLTRQTYTTTRTIKIQNNIQALKALSDLTWLHLLPHQDISYLTCWRVHHQICTTHQSVKSASLMSNTPYQMLPFCPEYVQYSAQSMRLALCEWWLLSDESWMFLCLLGNHTERDQDSQETKCEKKPSPLQAVTCTITEQSDTQLVGLSLTCHKQIVATANSIL